MKKVLGIAMLALVILSLCSMIPVKNDAWVRNRVLQLHSAHGTCSAVVVRTPKNRLVTLTAGHCLGLVQNGKVMATTESHDEVELKLITEDKNSDLLLLTAPKMSASLEVADKLELHQKVHAITHGLSKQSYRTDGETIQEEFIIIPKILLKLQI